MRGENWVEIDVFWVTEVVWDGFRNCCLFLSWWVRNSCVILNIPFFKSFFSKCDPETYCGAASMCEVCSTSCWHCRVLSLGAPHFPSLWPSVDTIYNVQLPRKRKGQKTRDQVCLVFHCHLLYPEDGSSRFFWNVGMLVPGCAAPSVRRQYSRNILSAVSMQQHVQWRCNACSVMMSIGVWVWRPAVPLYEYYLPTLCSRELCWFINYFPSKD